MPTVMLQHQPPRMVAINLQLRKQLQPVKQQRVLDVPVAPLRLQIDFTHLKTEISTSVSFASKTLKHHHAVVAQCTSANDGHCISVGIESIITGNGLLVASHQCFSTAEGRNKKEKG